MKKIDKNIAELRELTSEFIFIEYYSHENCDCYKILNEFTSYNQDKIVVARIDEGIEKAIQRAIEIISKRKNNFFN